MSNLDDNNLQKAVDDEYPYKANTFMKTKAGDSFLIGWGHIDKLARAFAVFGRTKGMQYTMEICKYGTIKVTRLK